METKSLSFEKMEMLNGGAVATPYSDIPRNDIQGASYWLEVGCVAGGIAMGALTGPAAALAGSLAVHACLGYFLSKAHLK